MEVWTICCTHEFSAVSFVRRICIEVTPGKVNPYSSPRALAVLT